MTGPRTQLTPKDAGELLDRALWFAQQGGFDVPHLKEPSARRYRARGEPFEPVAQHLLRAAVSLAGYSGDPTLLPRVIAALDMAEREDLLVDDHYGDADRDEYADAITRLLQLGAEVTSEVRALAKHDRPPIRNALALGLRDAAAEFEDLLRPMGQDPDAEVRATVRGVLAALGAPPWWTGLFSVDPALLVSEADAERVGPLLARWAEIVGDPFGTYSQIGELMEIVDQLPHALARECLSYVARSTHTLAYDTLAERVARLPDGIDLVLGLLDTHAERGARLAEAYGKVPAAQSEAAGRKVFDRLLAMSPAARSSWSSEIWRTVSLAGHVWPADADATWLVDRWFAEQQEVDDEARAHDQLDSAVDTAAARSAACVAAYRDRAVERHLDGTWPRSLHALKDAALKSLDVERLREVARRALRSESNEAASWGLVQLAGPAHDPERDPPVHELLASLCADPRLRDLLVSHHTLGTAHVELGRRYLRAGELGVLAACHVLEHLATKGELAVHTYFGRYVEPVVAPPAVTDEDRAAWRAIRDRDPWAEPHRVLMAMPTGPLEPADRAYLDEAIRRVRGGDETCELGVASVLAGSGSADDLPVLDTLVRKDAEEDGIFSGLRDHMKERLGLIPPRVRGKPVRTPVPAAAAKDDDEDSDDDSDDSEDVEWMDEDEDD